MGRVRVEPFSARLDSTFFAESWAAFSDFFFFFPQPHYLTKSTVNSALVHYSRTHKFHFLAIFLLKMGPTALFTHLKIILLQCFQFQFSVSVIISSIQTDPRSFTSYFSCSFFYFNRQLGFAY